jgi:hypothetical protein
MSTDDTTCTTCGRKWDGPMTRHRERLGLAVARLLEDYSRRHPGITDDEQILALADVEASVEESREMRAAPVRP